MSFTDLKENTHRSDTKNHCIEVHVREVSQLFNSMDPSPFNEKDLDRNAEDFIVGWAQEYPIEDEVSLRIHLDQWPEKDPKEQIREAIHHYFSYRARLTSLDLSQMLSQGRTSLLIGLSFLAACLFLIKLFLSSRDQATWQSLLRESLTIAGWVAMWKPMQTYLYDWWPLRRRLKVFSKLSRMHIEVVKKLS